MGRTFKFWKPVFHLVYIITISYFLAKRPSTIYNIKKVARFFPDMRHVLLWTNIPGLDEEGQNIFIKRKCPYINCYVTSNRTLFGNLGHFDAVLFNAVDVSAGTNDLPDVRSWSQKYIFVANDSSDNYPVCDPVYDPFFNWTWTYKLTSTIGFRHISIRNANDELLNRMFPWIPPEKMTPIDLHLKSQLSSKTKAAAIFLDKCKSRSKREDYIKNLQKHLHKYDLHVDIFGECGTKRCKRKTMSNCLWRLKHQYYFYLAFEDSFAPEYVTKEVLYGYENNAVPIVYGGADYPKFLPPNSYLNAIRLNEEALAEAMNVAIKNATIYQDFFRWRNHYSVKAARGFDPCDLCNALNKKYWLTFETKQTEFRKWWNPLFEQRCAKWPLNIIL
ncbi:alpha-(1,3)-fucosyltransferase C-like [Ostrinia furnacalis]|uniref:alpha-(1,3)-fucosyltransferase C-like n=1 Tax=Ostrinia furnacalis TaxID=93504 RepID=UPI00103C96F5|nr:alpha-(1,3)-fucosyltransferase C-like [Ostrinia furnacalis]